MVANKNSLEYAKEMDSKDPLKGYRDRFFMPQLKGEDVVYFTGNSLGLQPKSVLKYLKDELDVWATYGVEGHFEARKPWYAYHEFLSEKAARLVGANSDEVVVTHSLTTNLHLLLVTFYQPKPERYKILCEEKAFPSDQYVLESQVRYHGFDPSDAIVEVRAREGEHIIREEDIIAKIEELGDSLCTIMIGGINYYSGQLFDMAAITKSGHSVGAIVGFDLAHAAGNVILKMHDWEVDFAAWCSYKYLNSSPGGVAGMYIHEKHATNTDLPRFAGWWGHDKESRFMMEAGFKAIPTAEAWQLSNAPVLGMAAHLASLDIFDEVGMEKLHEKSKLLTAFLELIIEDISERKGDICSFEIITPKEDSRRGAQLSILAHGKGKPLYDSLA